MKDLSQLQYHATSEKIVDILCKKTQNINPLFFRVLVCYHLTKLASMMRVKIMTQDRGNIPVNLYAINLGNSGLGKGHATNIIEDNIINNFRTEFFEATYPVIVERNLATLATRRANIKGEDPDVMLLAVEKEFHDLGVLPFAFDSATTAAVKQMRHKLLMADIGSMNLEIDEIGSNLLSNADVLGTFLELFDVGKLKQKLTKNTRDNIRNEDIEGKTPTNLLLFGTPSKLLDGGKTEEEFYSFLETGYARRAIFGFTRNGTKAKNLTPEQIYDILTNTSLDTDLQQISLALGKLASVPNYNKHLILQKAESILLIEYRILCERRAAAFGEHEEIRKAELEHRYFKATKLAGTYAFIDGVSKITEDHIYAAIKVVEETGLAFNELLTRERNYAKLAKYIATIDHEITHVDLTEDLPFYKGGAAQKHDLMQLAIAWGYKNHIVIKCTTNNGIDFISGETLKKTDLNKMSLAYSNDIAANYNSVEVAFDKLHKLTQTPNLHWINHHLNSLGHRADTNIVAGFNMIVLDIDDGVAIDTVKLLLKNYTYMLHTTKRHTLQQNRFRVILPINYKLTLNADDYKEFMKNVYDWLPFAVDTATGQRSRKWATHKGIYSYNITDTLVDARLFIPKTAKNNECKKIIQSYQSLSNIERWFIQNMDLGNRNNQLLKYALILVDMGYDYTKVKTSVLELNSKLESKLTIPEIESTILVTVGKQIADKGNI